MRKLKRLIALLLLLGPLALMAQNKNPLVTLSVKDQPLKEVFRSIQSQTGLNIAVTEKILSEAKKISLQVKDMPLEEVLEQCLKNSDLSYSIVEGTIIVKKKQVQSNPSPANGPVASSLVVQGRVMNRSGDPFAGATVNVRGKNRSTVTNESGAFSILADENDHLLVSFVDYKPQQIKVNGRNNISIVLERIDKSMDEVTISNGFQRIQQKYLTGSVTSLNMDSIMQPGLNTVDKMLEGRVPGLIYMQNSGQAGAAPKLRIRGTSTYLGSREPLWVVDGIIRTNPIPIPADRINDPDFVNLLGNAVSGLNPYDIEQIDVLKDATAAALYGVRAANGVIVITTKRGKAGPPVINYNVTGTYTRRPRYTDRDVYMMDSRERVDVSREIIEKKMPLRGSGLEAYEQAIANYYAGHIDFATFQQLVNRAESVNTDWLAHTMRDVYTSNHTIGISGGNASTTYRASVGFNSEPGVIKKESNNLYTGSFNVQLKYRKFTADFNIILTKGKRRYTPSEIGVMNYAFGTSRAIPFYNEDGSPYFYSTLGSQTIIDQFYDFKKMNILHEMDHTGETVESNEYTASANLRYEIASGIQFSTLLAHTGGNTDHNTWFEENTDWAYRIRSLAWHGSQQVFRPNMDLLPFGGELRQQMVRKQNYTINGQLDFSRYLDLRKKNLLTVTLGSVLNSNRNSITARTSRGYYPERGFSFADIDLAKYTSYATWLRQYGGTVITEELQNSLSTFLSATYVFNDRYVLTATTSQEYSNAFGSRSNEKFLPTWALSGRWNIHEDLFKQLSWIEMAALRFSYGTRGNMLTGQTPYTIIRKGPINTYYDAYASTIVAFPNPDLGWEKKQDYNGNLEFSVLKGRIRGSIGYLYSKTTNAFLKKKVSVVNGVPGNSYDVNGGILENQGVELSLNFRIINNKGTGNKKGFMWRFDPQLGQVFNKLINNSLKSRNVLVDDAALTYQNYLAGNVPVNGKSVNTFYSYRFKTLDPQYGFPVFYGAEPDNKAALIAQYNKMTKEEVFSIVMIESGRREPVLQGGISNTFTYRNWSLDIMFSYSVGNKVRLLQISSGNYGTFRPSSQQNLRKEFVNRWRYPGDEQTTNIPAIQGGQLLQSGSYAWWIDAAYVQTNRFATDYYQMYDFSDIRVVKGDHIKLQSVALAYMVPRELCMKLNVKGATVRLAGSNLFTIANKALRGQDPAISGSSPNINLSIRPTYAFNLNLSF
ncbi:SusC/RagA family TonB-linked outer membrane protein [Pseudobacter ginsenosidimutans]|nr:SusC/RagA family TonB-linked outer membrane protein [Pseudobacter ginsenosidimutans]